MIKLNKKADIALIDIAFILLFALIFVILLIVFSLLGNPFGRNALPKENYVQVQSETILQGMLSSSIEYDNKNMSFAQFLRSYDLNEKDAKNKLGIFIGQSLLYRAKPFADADASDPKVPIYYLDIKKDNEDIEFGNYQGIILTNKRYITQTIPGYGNDITIEFGLLGYYTKKELGTFSG